MLPTADEIRTEEVKTDWMSWGSRPPTVCVCYVHWLIKGTRNKPRLWPQLRCDVQDVCLPLDGQSQALLSLDDAGIELNWGPSQERPSQSLITLSTPTGLSLPRKALGSGQHWFSTSCRVWGNGHQLWSLQCRIRVEGEPSRECSEISGDITHQPIFDPWFAGDRGRMAPNYRKADPSTIATLSPCSCGIDNPFLLLLIKGLWELGQ